MLGLDAVAPPPARAAARLFFKPAENVVHDSSHQ